MNHGKGRPSHTPGKNLHGNVRKVATTKKEKEGKSIGIKWYNEDILYKKGSGKVLLRGVLVGILLVSAVFGLWGCGPSGGGPGVSPSPSPGKTQAPQILSVTVGTRELTSGDAVQTGQNVVFSGQGPASVQIRVYLGGNLIGTTTTGVAGDFTFTWNSGTTEGTFTLEFRAKDPALPESDPVPFTLVVDGTGPSLAGIVARADAPLGTPPQVVVTFSEPIVVSDMTLFTLPAGFWTVSVGGTSVFNPTNIQLGPDKKTVTITGNALSDQLVAGDLVTVIFVPALPLTVTDAAGNPCVTPSMITGTVSP